MQASVLPVTAAGMPAGGCTSSMCTNTAAEHDTSVAVETVIFELSFRGSSALQLAAIAPHHTGPLFAAQHTTHTCPLSDERPDAACYGNAQHSQLSMPVHAIVPTQPLQFVAADANAVAERLQCVLPADCMLGDPKMCRSC